jgi:hypothetical protein
MFVHSYLPVVVVLIGVLVLNALFEAVGLKIRWNILVQATLALLCLVVALPLSESNPGLAAWLDAGGIVFSVVVLLYTLATAGRGKQWPWFVGLLLAALACVAGLIFTWTTLAQQNAAMAGGLAFALAFVPGICAALYGLLAPDVPRAGFMTSGRPRVARRTRR